ncbi:right-handed parallel beta-helix repeat-containing protein [Carboxylicivirga mesophila]|uniref:Right-handed parallel beta-helix repeat-containing protein n=1 Tax=Carboxylicivirga mesophila TaxID=1166478 RepID=A0ABS5K8T9_9BACT|nr:T9SS type A sorting domain-containing protein [Carboxylicivirga mesophila]MBS2211307.1 right-handed parallel beta-helix repeat-containing protein [Carboxylicivirga mesophila]
MQTRFIFLLFVLMITPGLLATNYYISAEGNDNNDGLTESTPWQTLAKVSEAGANDKNGGFIQPGDQILFRSGDTFEGQLVINRSGTHDNPIVISKYGDGELPILSGSGDIPSGDFIEAVKLVNTSHIVMDGIWIKNDRKYQGDITWGTNSSYGIKVIANKWGGISKDLTFRNLKITDVFGYDMIDWEGKFTLDYYNAKGIFFDSDKNDDTVMPVKEVRFEDVLIEDCYFYNLGSTAISARNLNPPNNPVSEEGRNCNFVIRNNTFEQLGGDGVVFASVCNGLVENNEFIDLGWGDHTSSTDRYYGRGEGCWIWDSHNIIVQYNRQYRARGFGDTYGAAGHIDFFCKNSIFQYNYSEDTEGGFVEILGDCENSTFRYNVSVNDGHRANGHHRYSIWLSGWVGKDITPVPSDENYIHNNTVYLDDPKCKPDISIFAEDTYIYNNIFYAMNGAQIGSGGVEIEMQNGGELKVSNNLFYGNIATAFSNLDTRKVSGDPLFSMPVSSNGSYDNFDIQSTSAAIDKGLSFPEPTFPMAGQGIFADVQLVPSKDVFGNAIDIENLIPNIGASNAHNSGDQVGIEDLKQVSDLFSIYPNPVRNLLNVNLSEIGKQLSYEVYSIQGQLVTAGYLKAGLNILKLNLPGNAKNGIYFIRMANADVFQTERFVLYR